MVQSTFDNHQRDQFAERLNTARALEVNGAPTDVVIDAYRAAIEAGPNFAEAYHGAARFCRIRKLHQEAYEFSLEGIRNSADANADIRERWIYDYGLLEECSVSAYWTDRFEESYALSNELLDKNVLTQGQAERIVLNANRAKIKIQDTQLMDLEPDAHRIGLLEAKPNHISGELRASDNTKITRTIHIVWIGDEKKRPNRCIETWVKQNPCWDVVIWGNEELKYIKWENSIHMKSMLARELCGVADMMRWEILYHSGGFAVDADSVCVRPLEDWLFEPEIFACWESEFARPGLIANGYVYSRPGSLVIKNIINEIKLLPNMKDSMAWKLTGPMRLTQTINKYKHYNLTIYPSHFFMPKHYTGISYTGSGAIFADQFWGGAKPDIYDNLAK